MKVVAIKTIPFYVRAVHVIGSLSVALAIIHICPILLLVPVTDQLRRVWK